MESAILRAQKLAASQGEAAAARYIDMTRVFCNDAVERIEARAKRLAAALSRLGVVPSDRVATLAWNGYRHLELYFAISGMGPICHTINPRLHPAQIAYILNHAGDRYVFVDLTFVPLLEALAPQLSRVRGYVILTGEATMPATTLPNALCYETLLAAQPMSIDWPLLDENTACGMCYTSGTTGNPTGVLYSHRSTLLHTFAAVAAPGTNSL